MEVISTPSGDGMGYFDSLFDSDLKALKKALKLIDDAENRLKRKDGSGVVQTSIKLGT